MSNIFSIFEYLKIFLDIMVDFSKFNSLFSMLLTFNSEDACINAIVESRWGRGDEQDIICPYCGGNHCVKRTDGRFRCKACGRNFSCRVGTIFEDSNLSLVKWFMAMYLISSHKKGISSCQLAKDIDVTQKTAWYMLQKVRTLYPQDYSESMNGKVELYEVYIGGREKWKHKSMRTPHTQGRSTVTKTPIFGMMERSSIINEKGDDEFMSYVHAFVVERTDGATLLPIVEQFIEQGSMVYTDELTSYNHLSERGYCHKICNHSLAQFVDGDIYTNTMEGFWSHFRRMILGCYHNVSDEHLQSYVDEACFRWNTRKMSQSERFERMFEKSIGIVKPNREFILCRNAA